MNSLPDPRTYARAQSPLAHLAAAAAAGGLVLQHSEGGRALLAALEAALQAGEGEIAAAVAKPGSAQAATALERGLEIVSAPPLAAAVGVRLFAFPVVLVAGGLAPGRIPGALPAVGELRELLEVHGALGQARNVGLGNALVSAEALAAVSLASLRELGRGAGSVESLGLGPEDIELQTEEEQAYLRFLVGAALVAREAPEVTETAANIGAWGVPWTRAIGAQLAQPGLSLLAVPRPPVALLRAPRSGRFVWHEMRLQLFLSRHLRDFRSRTGEPDVRVASHADGSVRVTLGSPLESSPAVEFRWPLAPTDDFSAVGASIFELLAECRLEPIDVASTVQPATASH